MTSGMTNAYSILYKSVIVLTIMLIGTGAVADAGYRSIMEKIASEGRNSVMFEEKIVAFYLEESLVSKGSMHFEPPEKLTKIIEEPENIMQVIQGGSVLITRGDKTQSFPLSGHTALEVMANTLRSLLSGNIAGIEEAFSVKAVVNGDSWRMELVPSNEIVLETIESVVIEGKAGVIQRYTITESNGDYTVTSLHDANGI